MTKKMPAKKKAKATPSKKRSGKKKAPPKKRPGRSRTDAAKRTAEAVIRQAAEERERLLNQYYEMRRKLALESARLNTEQAVLLQMRADLREFIDDHLVELDEKIVKHRSAHEEMLAMGKRLGFGGAR